MTVTRWWWLRHAPVVGQEGRLYGAADVACDCSDETLFRSLAARLPEEAVWIVSPLGRTRATAEAIARHRQKAPARFNVEQRFIEQDFGAWQGQRYDELAAARSDAWQRFWQAPAAEVPPGGESFGTLCRRVAEGIESLTRRHSGSDIVCVSHGGPIRAALGLALGLAPERALAFAIDNCALTRLDHIADKSPEEAGREEGGCAGGSWRIALVNARA